MTEASALQFLNDAGLRAMKRDAIKALPHVVYGVVNGADILQIGQGSGERAAKCMRGSLAAKHNKAFICAVYETISGAANRYFAFKCKSADEARCRERELHRALGVNTNDTAACILSGVPGPLTMEQVHVHVVARLRTTDTFRKLTEAEVHLAEQLFDLVTYATTRVSRSKNVVKSVQGDNLEGNILVACNRNHLIPVFQTLSHNYLRYQKHVPDRIFMQELLGLPFRYVVAGRPFHVDGQSHRTRIDRLGQGIDLHKLGLEPA